MTADIPAPANAAGQPAPASSGPWRWLAEVENILIPLALAALMLLPLIEIAGRKLVHRWY
jgi:hypothetical protein